MEIKLQLDTEKASKATLAITAAYELCRVSADTKYPQLAAANAIALIVIITILYGPHRTLKSTKSASTRSNMAEACYTAQATTKQQVLDGINKLTLQTSEHGQFTHNAILLIKKGIQCVLVSQFNPSDPGKGMVKLLDNGNNILTQVQSTDAIMAGSVLKAAKKQADKFLTMIRKIILPTFTTQTETQEEVDQLNVINQLDISAKEGVVEAVLKLVGSDIPDAILQMPDGSNHKSIDDFMLYKVMKVAINGADRPSTHDLLEQLIEVINHPFDFCKKVSVNMELIQSNVAQMSMYGIVIGIPQLTITLLANIMMATKSDYGREFCLAMHAICKKTPKNYVNDATLLKTILTELARADGVRALKDAPTSNAGTLHSVTNSVSFLNSMMLNNDTDSEYTKSAYGASSNSGSSEERRKSHEHENKKAKKSKSHRKQKKAQDKDDGSIKNTCPHCKTYHCKKSHCVKPDKCMWTKKYMGYPFKLICDELKVDFKPCIKFTSDLGRYVEKDNSGSE